MDFSSVAKTLAGAGLTTLATSLLGPAGPTVSGLLCGWLGLDAKAPDAQAQVEAKITDPAVLADLRIKTMEHEQVLTRLTLEAEANRLATETANTQGARNAEVEKARLGYAGAFATPIVATIVTLGFFIMLAMVLNGNVKADNQAAMLLLGSLASGFGAVLNYYLGSSSSSVRKDNLLLQAAPSGGK